MLNTKPPGAPTEYSNPSCYARAFENCDEEVTREHYISKKLLERLGEFEADGFGWLAGKKKLTATALQSKVLCKRHNNALGPLDDNITQLHDLLRRWQDRKVVGVLRLDGEDLERWAVKVMFGMFASGSARIPSPNGDVLPRATPIPRKPLRFLFGEIELPRRAGFYYAHSVFGDLRPTSVRCRVDRGIDSKGPDSIVFSLLGFTWLTSLKEPASGHIYRPSEFELGDSGRLTLCWNATRRRGPTIKLFEKRKS